MAMEVQRPTWRQNGRAFVLLAAAMLPVTILASLLVLKAAGDERRLVENRARIQLSRLVDRVDREISGHIEALTVLAESPSLDKPDFEAFLQHGKRAVDVQPLWRNLILVDTTGIQLANVSNPVDSNPRRVVDPVSFQRALESRNPVVGDTVPPSPYTGAIGIGLRVPVIRDGEVIYVLTAVLEPGVLAQIIRQSLEGGFNGIIADRNQNVIVRHSDGVARFGQPISDEAKAALREGEGEFEVVRTRDGVELVSVYSRSLLTGWSLHIGFPVASFSAVHNQSVLFAGLGGATCIMLAGVLIFLLYNDMRTRRIADAEQAQARKVEAIGQLTGGVAHDFNNLLAVVIGSLSLALKTIGDSPNRRRLELALQAAERGAALTKQLLAFARRAPLRLRVIALDQHISGLRPLLESSLRQDIFLRMTFDAALWPVEVDTQQLDTALINLAVNARDAMPAGGELRLSASNVSGIPDQVQPFGKKGAGFVELTITDTGTGMPQEVLERVFEPFFTTKGSDQGTGLGLSQVHGFVSQIGGGVAIESVVGRGTTIKLYLRRSEKQPERQASHSQTISAAAGQTILVVDDDRAVAEVTCAMVEDIGGRCLVARSAEVALAKLTEHRIDLVISDVVMPGGMDGVQLAGKIATLYPAIPVVLISGNVNDIPVSSAAGFLPKPFTLKDLERAIAGAWKARPKTE